MNGRTRKEFLLKIIERKRPAFYYEGISGITFIRLLLGINLITNSEESSIYFLSPRELPNSRELYKILLDLYVII